MSQIVTIFHQMIVRKDEKMISNYLKEYFKKNNISNYEIERRTGINQSKVNLSLNGKRKLTAEELIKIAIAFNLDLNKIKEIIQSPNLK